MKFQGALIKEQGVTFAIIVVKLSTLESVTDRDNMEQFGHQVFGPVPIILAAQLSKGRMKYWGRSDIVRFLSNIAPYRIPWKEYSVAA
ncbi:MAG TPA: hypothetical protein H9996_09275 [Candidatus Faecalibacterium avium]|uniref:hypothetical protein n=1 Tax=Faecalibacterium sp. An58 TaxID=1965648 RepID=UPI000B3A016F|nr:hypothetical protein [Faecalibacterium sp. An58]OUN75810.1 hypothetical protein B5G12_01700 [Faecalibacterium sp. An58]HIV44370.1 hypothetical protein [Candidatus Faecalibacterium avium]